MLLGLLVLGCTSQPAPQIDVADSQVVTVTDATFSREVLQSDRPVLVDLWAPWCSPCLAMKPAIVQASEVLDGEVKVVEINVDENPFVNEKYQVDALPTLLVVVGGKIVERSEGSRPLRELLELVQPYR